MCAWCSTRHCHWWCGNKPSIWLHNHRRIVLCTGSSKSWYKGRRKVVIVQGWRSVEFDWEIWLGNLITLSTRRFHKIWLENLITLSTRRFHKIWLGLDDLTGRFRKIWLGTNTARTLIAFLTERGRRWGDREHEILQSVEFCLQLGW